MISYLTDLDEEQSSAETRVSVLLPLTHTLYFLLISYFQDINTPNFIIWCTFAFLLTKRYKILDFYCKNITACQ